MADPVLSEAGKRGAMARWGPARHVNISDLPPAEREAVLAIIEAKRRAKQRALPDAGQS